jgi:magnesium chelatase family protein
VFEADQSCFRRDELDGEWGILSFKGTIESNSLSTGSMDRLAKVSRTVADLEGAEHLEPRHIDESASFVVGGMLRDAF